MITELNNRMPPREHVGHRCGMTGKHRFKTHAHALIRACEIMEEGTEAQQLRAYKCDFCGGYHLTKK